MSVVTWPSGAYTDLDGATLVQMGTWRGRAMDICSYFPTRTNSASLTNNYWLNSAYSGNAPAFAIGMPMCYEGGSLSQDLSADCTSMANAWLADGRVFYIRLGWEMNLPSWAWAVTDANVNTWKSRFGQYANIFKSIMGNKCHIGLNPNFGANQSGYTGTMTNLLAASPYIEWAGPDLYDWFDGFTSGGAISNYHTQTQGIDFWTSFCRTNNLGLAIPEWGAVSGDVATGHEGGDNPTYITEMVVDWMSANADIMGFDTYFNETQDYLKSDIFRKSGDGSAANPNAGVRYQSMFAGSSVVTATSTAPLVVHTTAAIAGGSTPVAVSGPALTVSAAASMTSTGDGRVFPFVILPIRTQIQIDNAWIDITSRVRSSDQITIVRGDQDEASTPNPATMNLTLNNRDGLFSPRNPMSPYYGLIGRNTPIRCSVKSTGYAQITQPTTTTIGTCSVSTPDSPGTSVTGDIDIQIDADLTSWRDAMELYSKWTEPSQRSYALTLTDTGKLNFWWSTTGSDAIGLASTVPIPITTGRAAVRVVLDVNNGVGGYTVTFYTGTKIDGIWTQLGDAIATASGTTSVFNSTALSYLLDNPNANFMGSVIHGRIYEARVRSGIGSGTATQFGAAPTTGYVICTDADAADMPVGTYCQIYSSGGVLREPSVLKITSTNSGFGFTNLFVDRPFATAPAAGDVLRQVFGGTLVASPNFSNQVFAASTFVDAQTNVWTVNSILGSLEIRDFDPRFTGEVTEWPQAWDITGTDVYTPITCADIRRRLGQGAAPLQSPMRRTISGLSTASLLAYWPGEDDSDSLSLASGLAGGSPMTLNGSGISLAADSSFLGSGALAELNGASLIGRVDPSTATGSVQIRFLLRVPSTGSVNGASILRIYFAGGAVAVWSLTYGTAGSLTLTARDSDDVAIGGGTSGPIGFAVDGKNLLVSVEIVNSGPNVVATIRTVTAGNSTISSSGFTLNGNNIGRPSSVRVNNTFLMQDVVVGHITVESAVTAMPAGVLGPLDGYSRETSEARIVRLSTEQGVAVQSGGFTIGNTPMGPQRRDTYLNLIQECATADGGILFSPRDWLAIAYRPQIAFMAQPPDLTLDYSAHQMLSLNPMEDDQKTVNDVTVTRPGGSSARAVDTGSSMSTLPPPAGVGTYDISVDLNVASDIQLADQAGWRLRLGTIDEPRYPVIDVNLAAPDMTGLSDVVASADIGSRLVVTNPPLWVPPDPISQLIRGYTERLSQYEWSFSFNCTPGSPFDRATVYGISYQGSRYSSDGSELSGSHNATTASLLVATPSGPLWTHADGDFDIRVGGERMTVTNITGSTSPQTFTVVRSVNGVVKTQNPGTAVELFAPAYYVL